MSVKLDFQLIVVAPPGRMKENLVALMDSLRKNVSVHSADDYQQACSYISQERQNLILVDFRHQTDEICRDIETTFQGMENVRLVLLRSRFFKSVSMQNLDVVELVYNDLSVDVIDALLRGVDKEQ